MNAITVVNFALQSLLLSAIGWAMVRGCVRDARHRAWASLLVLSIALIAPLGTELPVFRHDFTTSVANEQIGVPSKGSWKPDWKISTGTFSDDAAVTVAEHVTAGSAAPIAILTRSLCVILALGAFILALYHGVLTVSAWRLRRTLRPLTSAEAELIPSTPWRRMLRVLEAAGSPCVVGVWRPVIALPQGIFGAWSTRQWHWLLRHEGEHVRGGDTMIVWLLGWLKALLWWNPFAHALIEEWAQAREEICDGAAVRDEPNAAAYSSFLLDIAAAHATHGPVLLHMAASRPARRLRARMTAMMASRQVRGKVSHLFLFGTFAIMASAAIAVSCVGLKAADELTKPGENTPHPAARVAEALDPSAHKPRVRLVARWIEIQAKYLAMANQGELMPFVDGIINSTTLTDAEYQVILRGFANQKKGVSLMTPPSVTTRVGQKATVEMFREFNGAPAAEVAANGLPSPEPDFIGVQSSFLVELEGDKLKLETQADLGELDERDRAKPQVRHLRKSITVTMEDGHTLFLRMGGAPTKPERLVLLFVTAERVAPEGKAVNSDESVNSKRDEEDSSRESVAPPRDANTAPELSEVKFVTGAEQFPAGDEIIIDKVMCSSSAFKAGDRVVVQGHYTLASVPEARLALSLTTHAAGGRGTWAREQYGDVPRGSGSFERAEFIEHDGSLHVSFYDMTTRQSIGGVYFGTQQQVDRIAKASWSRTAP